MLCDLPFDVDAVDDDDYDDYDDDDNDDNDDDDDDVDGKTNIKIGFNFTLGQPSKGSLFTQSRSTQPNS